MYGKQQFHSEGAEGWGRYASIKSCLFCCLSRDALKKMFRQKANVIGLAHRTITSLLSRQFLWKCPLLQREFISAARRLSRPLNTYEQIHLSVSADAVLLLHLLSRRFSLHEWETLRRRRSCIWTQFYFNFKIKGLAIYMHLHLTAYKTDRCCSAWPESPPLFIHKPETYFS